MDRRLPILATVVSTCFDHATLQSRVTPRSLVTLTCPISTLFIASFSWGLWFSEWFVANTMLLGFIFRTYLFLATHSETNCSVAVISLAKVADVYSVESPAYINKSNVFIKPIFTSVDTETQPKTPNSKQCRCRSKACGMSWVKIEKKSKGPRQLPWGIPDYTWIMLERLQLKNPPLCVMLDRYSALQKY